MPLPYSNYRDGAVSEPPKAIKISEALPEMDLLEVCAEELLQAFKDDNIKGIARILRDVFDYLDSEPHVEGPHLNEE